MKLSELFGALQAAGDVLAYELWLAEPDRDGTDVDLASVGRVEIAYEAHEARLYPASTGTDLIEVDPEPYVGIVLSKLPQAAVGEGDLHLLVETPLIREGVADSEIRFSEIMDVHIGTESREVWLLLRPRSQFAAEWLPD